MTSALKAVHEQHPWIAVIPCWAHTIQLVAKDILELDVIKKGVDAMMKRVDIFTRSGTKERVIEMQNSLNIEVEPVDLEALHNPTEDEEFAIENVDNGEMTMDHVEENELPALVTDVQSCAVGKLTRSFLSHYLNMCL